MVMVRNAREGEVPRLVGIGLAAWEQAVAGVADAQRLRNIAELSFGSFLRENWPRTLVVESSGESVGWAARENADGEITDLWIMPGHQRQGLGSALIAGLHADILSAGIDRATARTHAGNAPAIAFLARHGYRVAWFSTAYLARLDRDMEQVGLSRSFADEDGPQT